MTNQGRKEVTPLQQAIKTYQFFAADTKARGGAPNIYHAYENVAFAFQLSDPAGSIQEFLAQTRYPETREIYEQALQVLAHLPR